MEEISKRILDKLDHLESDISGIKEQISTQVLTKLNNLESDVSGIKENMNHLESDVSCIKEEHGNRLSALETAVKTGFEGVNKKLDTIYAQVAHNTEQEVRLNDIAARVEVLETDNKLIKKLVANQ